MKLYRPQLEARVDPQYKLLSEVGYQMEIPIREWDIVQGIYSREEV